MGVFGVPVASFGPTLGSLGSLWDDFGVPFAPLGVTLDSLGLPLAPFGLPWGPSWLLLGKSLKMVPPGVLWLPMPTWHAKGYPVLAPPAHLVCEVVKSCEGDCASQCLLKV